MKTTVTQRWREQRASYRPAGEVFDPRGWSVEAIPDDTTPRAFLAAHHYLRTLPPAQHRFGLYAPGGALAGVAVFGVPSRREVFHPLPGSYDDVSVLSRFTMLPEVRGNGETWFLARALDVLRREGLSGAVTFADPMPRATAEGRVTTPGHIGNIYQATSATFIGRRRAETLWLLPDATSYDRRTLSKARHGERGQRYAVARLVEAGAEPPRGEDLEAWVDAWLPRVARRVRHPGNLKYVLPLTAGARRDVKRAVGEGRPYLKLCDVGLCGGGRARYHRDGCDAVRREAA